MSDLRYLQQLDLDKECSSIAGSQTLYDLPEHFLWGVSKTPSYLVHGLDYQDGISRGILSRFNSNIG